MKRVYQLSEILLVEGNSHGIDSKIPALLVIFQSPLLHRRISAFCIIAFLSCPYKFQLQPLVAEHRRAIGLENRHFGLWVYCGSYALRQYYSAALRYEIYIRRRCSLHQQVSDIATHNIDRQTAVLRCFRNEFK